LGISRALAGQLCVTICSAFNRLRTAVRNKFVVRTAQRGQVQKFEADLVVHGPGRVPEIDDLALDVAGVEWDRRRGVKVNEYLQSASNPAVYAAGDAAASGGTVNTTLGTTE